MKFVKGKIILIVISIILVFSACSPHIHLDFMGTNRIQEVVLVESKSKDKILVVDLKGTIGIDPNPGILNREGNLLSTIYYRLKKAAQDPHVKGIILRLDTPGGEGTTSDIIYNEILRFKEKTGIPVLALMMGVAASGGYYVACGCDFIMAHPTTITGSIGVIMGYTNFEEVLKKIGLVPVVIKSGELKDMGSPVKPLTDKERMILQDFSDEIHNQFIADVATGRNMEFDKVKELADGRIYTGKKALELGLVDELGNLEDAIQVAGKMAGIKGKIRAVYPKEDSPLMKMLAEACANKFYNMIYGTEIKAEYSYKMSR